MNIVSENEKEYAKFLTEMMSETKAEYEIARQKEIEELESINEPPEIFG